MYQTPQINMLSEAERLAIEEEYLKHGRAVCPRCHDHLMIRTGQFEGPIVKLEATCGSCKSQDEWTRAKRHYRKWTQEEAEQVDRVRKGHCPVENCGALLKATGTGRAHRWVSCPGCDNSTQGFKLSR